MKNKNRKRLLCTTFAVIMILSVFTAGIVPVSAEVVTVTRAFPSIPLIIKTNAVFDVTLEQVGFLELPGKPGVGIVNETLPAGFTYVPGSLIGNANAFPNEITNILTIEFLGETTVTYTVKASSFDQIPAEFSGTYKTATPGLDPLIGSVGGDKLVVVDGTLPKTEGHAPARYATNVPVDTNIVVHVKDNFMVNSATIVMRVEGGIVTPVITGVINDYTVTYNPPTDFPSGEVVEVTINASDMAGNAMTDKYSFTTEAGVVDTEPPIVTNPNANPAIIPEDTDNEPRWGELANLSVVVTDESELASVKINLSSIGGSAVQPMTRIGASNVWNVSTNASVGSAIFDGGGYMPHLLRVNATDEYGNSNTSVSIELMVMRNGDVDRDGSVTYSDAMYLYKWKAGKPGFDTIYETVADVDGDSSVTYSDAMYLYKWKAGKPGFNVLH